MYFQRFYVGGCCFSNTQIIDYRKGFLKQSSHGQQIGQIRHMHTHTHTQIVEANRLPAPRKNYSNKPTSNHLRVLWGCRGV